MEHKNRKGLAGLFRAMKVRRRKLARLPFERKILLLADLQRIANDLRLAAEGNRRRA